jgi:hypothetical protein
MSVSVMPSDRYSASWSPVALMNGSKTRRLRSAAIARMSAAAIPPQIHRRRFTSAGASNDSDVDVPSARKANDRSRADWNRSARFFSRQRWMIRASSYGISRSDTVKTSGVSVRIADSESMTVPRMNAGRPVAIS